MYITLGEIEKDVLREMLNISLAKAADTFAHITNGTVLLDVPDVKIVEPEGLAEVLSEYENTYTAIQTSITGDIVGATFLLFSRENIERFCSAYKQCNIKGNGHLSADEEELLLQTSYSVTSITMEQLTELLKLDVEVAPAKALYDTERHNIDYIIEGIHLDQPIVITIRTQFNFNRIWKTVELPMLIFFNSETIQKILRVMRNSNLYEYKLLIITRKGNQAFQKS